MGFWRWLTAVEEEPEYRGLSISDPALAAYFGLEGTGDAGQLVTEDSALGLSAVYRAISIIAGTIAGLPLKSYRTASDGTRERVSTFLDNPHGPGGLTPFEWVELVLVHLLIHGNAYLLHVYNGAGALVGLAPIHPSNVTIVRENGGVFYRVSISTTTSSEQRDFAPPDLTHIPALGTDGIEGRSPIYLARRAISTGLAGDKAAARMFKNGLLIAGLVSTEEDVTEEEARDIKVGLDQKMAGADNAGDIAFVNRTLKFSPWMMNSADAQFIESRAFQIEEVARIFGVPPHLLGQTEKQTSWGTGVSEQNRGLARYTLAPWTTRLEQRLSRLLTRPVTCEFDYAGLLQPAPQEEITMLIAQVDAGILTVDEARRIRNLPPLEEAPAPEEEEEDVESE